MTILACKGCRGTKEGPTGDPSDLYPSEHCGDCPPWRCEDCGEWCTATALCSCWVRLADLSFADIKALFATDGFDLRPPTHPDTTGETP